MEKDFDSWFQDHKIDWQSPDPNISGTQFGPGPQVTNRTFEPCGWFYGLPRYRQGLGPVVSNNSIVKEQIPVAGPDIARPMNGAQKKFLVFDRSGDQTTLIYSAGIGAVPTRYQFPSSNNPKPQSGSYPVHVDQCIKENDGGDSRSEMKEDTEELNALLYSDDDDDDDDDDDETSTGHSPNSIQKQENGSEEKEEVASSVVGPTKKRKREDGGNIVNSLEDTASSGKSGINCSGNDGNFEFEEEFDIFSCGNKRLRKENLKETINLIKNLIPGDKNGKNAVMVIDEAIQYLRSLKVKAKALGLDSL